jgi:hypothetical protein
LMGLYASSSPAMVFVPCGVCWTVNIIFNLAIWSSLLICSQLKLELEVVLERFSW